MQSLSFDERLFELLDAQALFLKNRRIVMNRRLSKIKNKSACINEIDYYSSRKLDMSVIHALATLDFIRMHHNIIITGKTGTGKSYLAQALTNCAIEGGFRSYYIRMPSLLEEIRIAKIDGTYTNLLRKYSRFQLLILDDFGIAPVKQDDAVNLFEIMRPLHNTHFCQNVLFRKILTSSVLTDDRFILSFSLSLQNRTYFLSILCCYSSSFIFSFRLFAVS